MLKIDAQLLTNIRRLIDEANGHLVNEMIFAYEQAVDLHNRRWPKHEIYQIQSEMWLRSYVRQRQDETIRRQTIAANKLADEASLKSIAVLDAFDRLERRIEEWTQMVDIS